MNIESNLTRRFGPSISGPESLGSFPTIVSEGPVGLGFIECHGLIESTVNMEVVHKGELTFLISGSVANLVPEEVKSACAAFVSKALSKHPNTMLQFTPDQILESINKGWTVMVLEEGLGVVGFAQLWQYGFNEDGQQILEFGSWLSFRSGWGARILKEAIYLGNRINPTAQIIAIAEEENLKAQAILMKVGASEIGSKFSPAIRTVEGEAAFMKIFDITRCI